MPPSSMAARACRPQPLWPPRMCAAGWPNPWPAARRPGPRNRRRFMTRDDEGSRLFGASASRSMNTRMP
jgi:hypothetical protein